MLKKVGIILVCIPLIFFILFLGSIKSANSEKSYNLKEMDDFLESLEEQYHFIKDTDVVEFHHAITLRIYFNSHPDLEFDDTIYEDIRTFFMNIETKEAILKKQGGLIRDRYYPKIVVEFIDNVGFDSHFFKTPIEPVIYNVSYAKPDMYSQWTEIRYSTANEE